MYIHIDIAERCTGHICIINPLDNLYDTTLVQALQAIRYDQEIGARFEMTRNDDYSCAGEYRVRGNTGVCPVFLEKIDLLEKLQRWVENSASSVFRTIIPFEIV